MSDVQDLYNLVCSLWANWCADTKIKTSWSGHKAYHWRYLLDKMCAHPNLACWSVMWKLCVQLIEISPVRDELCFARLTLAGKDQRLYTLLGGWEYLYLAEGRPFMASLYAVSSTSTLSQFRWMEHWWWGPGLSSGVGDARKFGSLSTATVQDNESVFALRSCLTWMKMYICDTAKSTF